MVCRTDSPIGRYPTKSAFRASDCGRGLRATGRALVLTSAIGRKCSRRLVRKRFLFIPRQRANHAIGRLAAQIGASSANATKMACCTWDTSVLQSLGRARQVDATTPATPRHASESMRGHRRLPLTTRQIAAANSHFLITGDDVGFFEWHACWRIILLPARKLPRTLGRKP